MRSTALFPRLAAMALACLAAHAAAITRGQGPGGVSWMSGGIGDEETAAMQAEFGRHDLWVTTAARGSGAFLAGVHVHVKDAKGASMVDVDLDGPWLLVQLPPGRYDVEASLLDPRTGRLEVQRGSAEVAGRQLRQLILYFDTGDEVSPEREAPKVSPYKGS